MSANNFEPDIFHTTFPGEKKHLLISPENKLLNVTQKKNSAYQETGCCIPRKKTSCYTLGKKTGKPRNTMRRVFSWLYQLYLLYLCVSAPPGCRRSPWSISKAVKQRTEMSKAVKQCAERSWVKRCSTRRGHVCRVRACYARTCAEVLASEAVYWDE